MPAPILRRSGAALGSGASHADGVPTYCCSSAGLHSHGLTVMARARLQRVAERTTEAITIWTITIWAIATQAQAMWAITTYAISIWGHEHIGHNYMGP